MEKSAYIHAVEKPAVESTMRRPKRRSLLRTNTIQRTGIATSRGGMATRIVQCSSVIRNWIIFLFASYDALSRMATGII